MCGIPVKAAPAFGDRRDAEHRMYVEAPAAKELQFLHICTLGEYYLPVLRNFQAGKLQKKKKTLDKWRKRWYYIR